MLLCYQLMLLERSFVISHNLYIVEWVYIVLKRYTHKYRLLIWNLSIEKHYQSWLYLWNCCNKSDVALFSVSTQSIKYKVKSLYRYMLKSVFFQVPGGKACNEFLFLNLVSVYFKLIKEWEKTRGAGHFWHFKFWSTLLNGQCSRIRCPLHSKNFLRTSFRNGPHGMQMAWHQSTLLFLRPFTCYENG